VALLLVLANALRPRRRGPEVGHEHGDEAGRETATPPTILELKVSGMRCNGCVQSLTRALGEVAGVTRVEVRLEDGAARVEGCEMSGDGLSEAVRSLGFTLDNPQVLGGSSRSVSMVP
jgi:copper chaperone CopZ